MILSRRFYERHTVTVARDLLGKVLVHGDLSGEIVETEAYPGGDDLASHSAAGITPRTKVIFGPAGHAYVYLSYGIHVCMNVVVGKEGTPGCVLLRGLKSVTGPGRLTKAMGITLAHYGADLTKGDLTIRDEGRRPGTIEVTKRIGLTKCADLPLRFVLK